MRILWFEVTEPSLYNEKKQPIGGWQDALSEIVATNSDFELIISFFSNEHNTIKVKDGITYHPISFSMSFVEKYFRAYWDVYAKKLIPELIKIVETYTPDVIHVFGTEWPYGLIAKYVKVPVVVHIQGAVIPYQNAAYPPGYSVENYKSLFKFNLKKQYRIWKNSLDSNSWKEQELQVWNSVSNFMGRTNWDKALSNVMHPGCCYYHVEEALRPSIIRSAGQWRGLNNNKLSLISTGCSTFWKGPDLMLKVARIFMSLNIDFEWNVAGLMPDDLKKIVEKKECIKFEDCRINILGYLKPNELIKLLCSSSIYVHTAYIENSPNSICEAQIIGIPVVSTNVGGISSIVPNENIGILVPANDPWQMAYSIIHLFMDKERMKKLSLNSINLASKRHNPNNIMSQLKTVYYSLYESDK